MITPMNQLSANSTPMNAQMPMANGARVPGQTQTTYAQPMESATQPAAQRTMQTQTPGTVGPANQAGIQNQATRGNYTRAQQLGMGSGRPASGVAGGSMGGAPQFNQFREYQDAAYDDRMRTLQPQLEQQSAAMAQSLVNRGLQPGSEAYNAEMNRMQAAQGGALDDAHFGAMQFGLGAQNQAFSQQNAMDQLANALAISRGNNATQMGISNNNLALGQDRLAFDQDRFGQEFSEGNRRFDLGFGEGQRQFNSNDMFRNNQNDFGQMMALENLGYRDSRDAVGDSRYNDQLTMALLGMAPGFGGSGVNVNGAFQTGNQSAMNNYNANNSNYQSNMAGLGSLVGLFSDENLKTDVEHVDTVDGVNVYEYRYEGSEDRWRGVSAQEVSRSHPDAVSMHPTGFLVVDYDKLPVNMVAA